MVYAMYPDAAAACLERIAALCSPELRCEELLAQAYCGCVPGASEKEGEVMAGAAVDAVRGFAGWQGLAEQSPADFAGEYAREAGGVGERRLARLLRLAYAGRDAGDGMCAAEAILSLPQPKVPAAGEADADAMCRLTERGAWEGLAAWEAVALYAAYCARGRAPEMALRQLAAACCGSQAALEAACAAEMGWLTGARLRSRLRASRLVSAAMLCTLSPAAFEALYHGDLESAALSVRRAEGLAASRTRDFNLAASAMLEALDTAARPLDAVPMREARAGAGASEAPEGRREAREEEKDGLSDEDGRLRDE